MKISNYSKSLKNRKTYLPSYLNNIVLAKKQTILILTHCFYRIFWPR